MGFYHLLVGSLLDPQDDFTQRLRKQAVSFLFFPGSFFLMLYLVLGAYRLAAEAEYHKTGPFIYQLITFIGYLVLLTTYVVEYAWLRKTRHVAGVQASLLVWVQLFTALSGMLMVPEVDNKHHAVLQALLAISLQIPLLPVFLASVFLYSIISMWNVTHVATPEVQLRINGLDLKAFSSDELFVASMIFLILVSIVIGIVVRQAEDSKRRGAAQKAANEMTLQILKYQRKYETQKIRDVLDQYDATGVVDTELLGLHRSMNDTLESYRPFLPNYFFLNDDSSASGSRAPESWSSPDGGGVDGGAMHDEERRRSLESADSSCLSYADVEDIETMTLQDELNDASDLLVSLDFGGGERRQTVADVDPNPLDGKRRRSVVTRPMSSLSTRGGEKTHRFRCLVTMALIDIQVDRLFSLFSTANDDTTPLQKYTTDVASVSPTTAAITTTASTRTSSSANLMRNKSNVGERDKGVHLRGVVDLLYVLAKDTKASVHSMLGDTVQLTWNATHTLSLPESKGAVFLAKLRKLVSGRISGGTGSNSSQHPCIAGAVCSGEATVHSIISATQQRALVVNASWMPALTGCFDLAKRHGAMLMDERTANGASLSVEGCAVEKVFYQTAPYCTSLLPNTTTTSSSDDLSVPPAVVPRFLFSSPLSSTGGSCSVARANSTVEGDEVDVVSSASFASASGSSSAVPPSTLPHQPYALTYSSLVFQILGEKVRNENLEWMYQLDNSEVSDGSHHQKGGPGLEERASHNSNHKSFPSQVKYSATVLQQSVIEAYAEGRTEYAFEALEATSVSVGGATCLPSLRAAMVTTVRAAVGDSRKRTVTATSVLAKSRTSSISADYTGGGSGDVAEHLNPGDEVKRFEAEEDGGCITVLSSLDE